jgi:hypothetical protein
MFKSPLTCSAREINIIRKKLKETERYTKFGGRRLIYLSKTQLLTEMKINYVHIVNLNLQKMYIPTGKILR